MQTLSRQIDNRDSFSFWLAPIHKAIVATMFIPNTPTSSNLNCYLHHFFHFSALPLDIRWQQLYRAYMLNNFQRGSFHQARNALFLGSNVGCSNNRLALVPSAHAHMHTYIHTFASA